MTTKHIPQGIHTVRIVGLGPNLEPYIEHSEDCLCKVESKARLISAAPDLLEACRLALQSIDAIEATKDVPIAVAGLRAAIAKATGES